MGASATIAFTRFIADYDFWVLVALVVLAVGVWGIGRFVLAPATTRRWIESLPLIGPMLRFVALAEFCHLAAILIEAETPLPEALDLAGASVSDPALGQSCGLIALRVAEGEPFSSALQLWASLPAALGQLLAWGEAHENLAAALRFAGDMFETRAESQATFSTQVFGALLLILIFWLIALAIASVYLPLQIAFRMMG